MTNPLKRYAMVLAERLGMTRDELLERMDSPELTDWMAHDRTHVSESWQQAAMICQTIVATFTGKSLPLSTWIPRQQRRAETPAQIKGRMNLLREPPKR